MVIFITYKVVNLSIAAILTNWHKPNSCNSEHDLHDFWHEGEHQKARSRARVLARGKAPKNTICGTKESTKKHDLEHGFWHEGEHQKARFLARGTTTKTTSLFTKESTKKHDPEHNVWTKESNARRRAPKSTIYSTVFGTRESGKKHDFWHDGEHQKARFCAGGGTPKSTI